MLDVTYSKNASRLQLQYHRVKCLGNQHHSFTYTQVGGFIRHSDDSHDLVTNQHRDREHHVHRLDGEYLASKAELAAGLACAEYIDWLALLNDTPGFHHHHSAGELAYFAYIVANNHRSNAEVLL